MPAVSVLLPVRNASEWLDASLRSLWRQTFRDFEVVAIDDGSTDGSGEALDRAARTEPRLRVVHTGARGLPLALNEGLRLARAPLIARHDGDDVAHRSRLALQHETLAREPDIAVVGARIRVFPSAEVGPGMRRWADWHNTLLTHAAMRHERYIDSPLSHAAAMLRRDWLERMNGWAERGWAEDLDLWMRLFEAGARFTKRPEVLVGWRQHRRSATRRDPRYRRERFIALKVDALERTLLRGHATMTLVGVGDSLARCVALFSRQRCVHAIEAGRARAVNLNRLVPPVVLVFGSPIARRRWREALDNSPWREDIDFVFIA